eukprot:TRINITY_DN3645_c0_g2_i6.p1 TRINITY_DN3645_c0_g2~~TRINITY_DN3645_c0_g2_i6.p1  ORF type:complete len:275 (+),score=49.47 TRINITY_DN3645_c0_g2_i6:246-1070(+)
MEALMREDGSKSLQFQEIALPSYSETSGEIQSNRIASEAPSAPQPRGQVGASDFQEPSQSIPEIAADVRFWQLAYYQLFFNVDTEDVLWRILHSMIPYSDRFYQSIERNPDLYGPFWISTTLIFAIGVAGNFGSYLAWYLDDSEDHDGGYDEWKYDLGKITFGAGLIYVYATLVPLLLHWGLSSYESPMRFTHVVCIYGYSLFVFIPTAILSAIPSVTVQIALISTAFLISAGFLLSNFWDIIRNYVHKYRWAAVGGIIAAHFVLTLTMKLAFF